MPKSTPREPANQDMEILLSSVYSYIPDIVHNACHSLGHHPQQMELDSMVQEIILLLMDDDYRVLKSFDPESDDLKSEFSKWLFTIAWRRALHRFQEQSRFVSLENLPDDYFASPPDQEAAVMLQEQDEQQEAALQKLTTRERLLFELTGRGLSRKDIAKELGIQPKSVSPMRNALIKKKIPRIINRMRRWPGRSVASKKIEKKLVGHLNLCLRERNTI